MSSYQFDNLRPLNRSMHFMHLSIVSMVWNVADTANFVTHSPVDGRGNPVAPELLQKYIAKHTCPMPHCACNYPCRFIKLRARERLGTQKIALACGNGYSCDFWGKTYILFRDWLPLYLLVVINDLRALHNTGILYERYESSFCILLLCILAEFT